MEIIMIKLLYCSNRTNTCSDVLCDLKIISLFSPNVQQILSHPATAAEISSRQELFSCLDNPTILELFKKCRSALVDFKKILELYEDCNIKIQKYYLFAQLLHLHIYVSVQLSQLRGCSRFDELSKHYSSWLQSTEAKKEHFDYESMVPILAKMRKAHIKFGSKSYLCHSEETCGYIGQIDLWAKEWGYDMPEESDIHNLISYDLSEAFSIFFETEFITLDQIISTYVNTNFVEPIKLISQIDFFLEIHELTLRAKKAELPVCLSKISKIRCIKMKKAWDITLLSNDPSIIQNDVHFDKYTPFYFLLGANGGGKTSYLRSVGINLILFLAGCPVFAEAGEIYPFAEIKTHFPRDERFSFVGRLDEEYRRSEKLLENTASNCVLLYNETFSGANEEKGLMLTLDVAKRITDSGCFGLFVTHFHKTEGHGYPILSTIVKKNGIRTYLIVPKSALGNSHASDILKKYQLDPISLSKRKVAKE